MNTYWAVWMMYSAWALGFMQAKRKPVEPRFAWLAEICVAVCFGVIWPLWVATRRAAASHHLLLRCKAVELVPP